MKSIRSILERLLLAGATAEAAAKVGAEVATRKLPDEPARHAAVRFEPKDVNSRAVLFTGIGVLVGTLLITVLVFPLFRYLESYRAATTSTLPASGGRVQAPPEPRLQQN